MAVTYTNDFQMREFEHFWARIEGIKVFGDALVCGLGVWNQAFLSEFCHEVCILNITP